MQLLKRKHLPRYTIKDYEKWEGDWELIEGIPYALASPSLKHQRLVFIIASLLENALRENGECEECITTIDTDYVVNETTVFRPNIAIVCNNEGEKITKTPTLIVEVVSPATKRVDEEIKPMYYAREGVKYYLLVYPEGEKMVLNTLSEDGKYTTQEVNGEIEFTISEGCKVKLNPKEIWRRV